MKPEPIKTAVSPGQWWRDRTGRVVKIIEVQEARGYGGGYVHILHKHRQTRVLLTQFAKRYKYAPEVTSG